MVIVRFYRRSSGTLSKKQFTSKPEAEKALRKNGFADHGAGFWLAYDWIARIVL